MGIERMHVQQIMRADGELGPAGELVWKPINDKFNQIRLVGNGWLNQVNGDGSFVLTQTTGEYVEITFYGTGLNVLCRLYSGSSLTASLDNGAYGANLQPTVISAVLSSRNYNPLQVVPVFSNQTLGIHTVRIQCSTPNFALNGFEILNEATTMKVATGTSTINGKLLTLSSLASFDPLKTGSFDSQSNTGSTTRGGRVVVYQKTDGSIGKSITWVNSAQANLTSADHTNEEVIRSYYWREFGVGRSDDFSTLIATSSTRAFALEDGTTSLYSEITNVQSQNFNGLNVVQTQNSASAITFAFIGTGLDVIISGDSVRTDTILVDGTSIGTVISSTNKIETKKIVSGLPYGTHVVKFTSNAGSAGIGYSNFIVYGPKKPSVPSGAVELADYNIMADFVANSTADINKIATGVLRKHVTTREGVYIGATGVSGPNPNASVNRIGGWFIDLNLTTAKFQYTFFGTGFDFRCQSLGTNVAVLKVDGAFPTATAYGTHTYNGTNGQITGVGAEGAGVYVTGLTLGTHTITIDITTASDFLISAVDIITPIHTQKNNGPYILQNTLPVGSNYINDSRKFVTDLNTPSKGLKGFLTTSYSFTGNPNFSPVKWLNGAVYCDKTTKLNLNATFETLGGSFPFKFMVDGQFITAASAGYTHQRTTAGQNKVLNVTASVVVPAGWHFVSLDANDGAASGSITSDGGEFNVYFT
jgi:hypothetical protein